jgi:hypothetical protein
MKKLQTSQIKFTVSLLVISLVTILFMQPITKPIWENVTLIRQFQFPWRFLGVINLTTSLAAFAFFSLAIFQKKIVYFSFIIMIVISTIYYWIPYQGYQKYSEEYFWNFSGSTTYFGEINSIWMAGEPLGFPEKRIDVAAGSAKITDVNLKPVVHLFTIESTTQATIVDKTQFYPGWRVMVDGSQVPVEFQDQNYRGLITFKVPTGKHEVRVYYGENKLQLLSDGISIMTLGLLICGFFIFRNKRYAQKVFA